MASLRPVMRLVQLATNSPSAALPASPVASVVGVASNFGCRLTTIASLSNSHVVRSYSASSGASSGPSGASADQPGSGGSSAGAAGASSSTAHDEYDSYDQDHDYEGEHNDQHDRDRALRRVLRSSNAAELAAVHFFRGFSCVRRGRVDAEHFAAQEEEAAESVRQLLPRYRVRPSLGQGPLSLACTVLGALAAAAPPHLGLAVTGAVGDALTEHYNEQLRQLNEAGAAQQAPDIRQALRSLRDVPRVPEGAPAAPDLVSVLQEGVAAAGSGSGPTVLSGVTGALREWGLEGTVGAVVKAGARVALGAAARL